MPALEVQNRGMSGPQKGLMSSKIKKKKNCPKSNFNLSNIIFEVSKLDQIFYWYDSIKVVSVAIIFSKHFTTETHFLK